MTIRGGGSVRTGSVGAGAWVRAASGIRGAVSPEARGANPIDGSPSLVRRAAAPHLTARRPPGAGGLRLRGLARGGGPVLVADVATRPARPLWLAVQGGVGVRRLAGAPRGARCAREPGGGGGVPRARRVLDRGLGA